MPVPGLRDRESRQRLKSLVFGKFRNFGKLRSVQHWDICQRFQTSRTLAARADFAAALNTTHRKGGRACSSVKQHQNFAFWNTYRALSRHFLLSFCRQVSIQLGWPPLLKKRDSKKSISIPPNYYNFRGASFCWYFWGNGGSDGKQRWPRLIPIWSTLKRKGINLTIVKTIIVI